MKHIWTVKTETLMFKMGNVHKQLMPYVCNTHCVAKRSFCFRWLKVAVNSICLERLRIRPNKDQCEVTQFLSAECYKPVEIRRRMVVAYREKSLSNTTFADWSRMFSDSRTETTDLKRPAQGTKMLRRYWLLILTLWWRWILYAFIT